MNTNKGLRRLAIVIALFWIVGWSAYAFLGIQQQNAALDGLALLDEQYPERWDNPAYASLRAIYMEPLHKANRKIELVDEIGLYVPVGLLILAPFVWFTYRGFKPKRDKQPTDAHKL